MLIIWDNDPTNQIAVKFSAALISFKTEGRRLEISRLIHNEANTDIVICNTRTQGNTRLVGWREAILKESTFKDAESTIHATFLLACKIKGIIKKLYLGRLPSPYRHAGILQKVEQSVYQGRESCHWTAPVASSFSEQSAPIIIQSPVIQLCTGRRQSEVDRRNTEISPRGAHI